MKYYILDTRSCVGNCAQWWRPKGAGYTCNLDEAWLVGEDFTCGRPTDQKVPEAEARAMVVAHVRWEGLSKYLRQAHDEQARVAKRNRPTCGAMTEKDKRCRLPVAHDGSREGDSLCHVHVRQAQREDEAEFERAHDVGGFVFVPYRGQD